MKQLLLTFLCFITIGANAQWLELNGPGLNQPYNNLPGDGGVTFTIGGSVYYGTGSIDFSSVNSMYNCDFFEYDINTGKWLPRPVLSNFCNGRRGASSFTFNGKAYICGGEDDTYSFNDLYEIDVLTGVITQKATLPNPLHHGISFVQNGKAYVGGGYAWNTSLFDLYSYDFASNTWQTEPPLPASIYNTGNTFVMEINNEGYMLVFRDTLGNLVRTWSKYDSQNGGWNQCAPYPGHCVYGVSGFAMSDQGFIGFGKDTSYNSLSEFFQYDALNDVWIQKNSYNKIDIFAEGFSNGVKAGIISEHGSLSEYDVVTDTWQEKVGKPFYVSGSKMIAINNIVYGSGCTYNISNDSWSKDSLMDISWVFKLNNIGYGFSHNIFSMYDPSLPVIPFLTAPAPPNGVHTFFSIGNKGYAGDFYNDITNGFWEFDPLTQAWTRKADFPGPTRDCGGGFSIGSKGYITGGWCDSLGWYIYDFWNRHMDEES